MQPEAVNELTIGNRETNLFKFCYKATTILKSFTNSIVFNVVRAYNSNLVWSVHMKRKKIACIYCGNVADILKKGELRLVSCDNCKRETELDAYQRIFDQWVDDKRKDANAKKITKND